jgi:hypothetical protein
MNPRRLVLAVALPVVALAAAVPAEHHQPGERHQYEESSYSRRSDGGPLRQPALQHRVGSRASRASRPHRLGVSHVVLLSTRVRARTMANVDYASGRYGAYSSAALRDSWVQGVVINLDWRAIQTSPGTSSSSYNWAPLDRAATAWANAGKHIALVVRATNEVGGGCSAGVAQILPGWEITALHNALGRIGTFCDKDLEGHAGHEIAKNGRYPLHFFGEHSRGSGLVMIFEEAD